MLTLFRDIFSPPRHMILLVAAAWIGLSLAEKRAERYGVSKEDLNNAIFNSLIALVAGGRIFFVLQNLSAFSKSPFGIFSINPDLFDPIGGLAAAIVLALVYGQRRGLKFWSTLDALTPFFSILTVGIGLSHFAAGTSFGKETDLPFGIELWNATRHPTQIYETLAAFLTFGLIWLRKENPASGILFLTFAALTAFSQIVIQSFRADIALISNGSIQGQITAWLVLLICFILFEFRFKQAQRGE